jgi:hypothetical protein
MGLLFLKVVNLVFLGRFYRMYQKDYILRMVEMFGELLRAIFGMITRGDYNQATKAIDEAYLTMLRKDAAFFQQIPAHELTTTLITNHNYTNGHLEILAELLYAEASLQYTTKIFADSLLNYKKSIILFEFVDKANRIYSNERQEKMEQIRKRILEISELPPVKADGNYN